jgi:site-specific DNA-methyltransferase (adenine-specific)
VTARVFLDGRVTLHCDDCLDVLDSMDENSVDSVACDPPYHLHSIVKRFAKMGRTESTRTKSGPHQRTATGFMGKKWDGGDIAFQSSTWAKVMRVLKPGGYVVAFSGTRTYHRMACAIEDGGFDVRDQIGWAYGSGFPKSHNLGEGRGTALKPAWEPICLARKPIVGTNAENVARFGTGGLNIDLCRVEMAGEVIVTGSGLGGDVFGGGAGLRTERQSFQSHSQGRWPANVIHDGSAEVLAAFPEAPGQMADACGDPTPCEGQNVYGALRKGRGDEPSADSDNEGGVGFKMRPGARRLDEGSAARFFYTAKADAEDRIGSKHPTVKPLDLMQYLVRLVTPPGGLVLDPFAGTGTTGEAAWREGMRAILIEREPEYQADIARRMELAENPTKRAAVAKSKNNLQGAEGTPLFGGEAP